LIVAPRVSRETTKRGALQALCREHRGLEARVASRRGARTGARLL